MGSGDIELDVVYRGATLEVLLSDCFCTRDGDVQTKCQYLGAVGNRSIERTVNILQAVIPIGILEAMGPDSGHLHTDVLR